MSQLANGRAPHRQVDDRRQVEEQSTAQLVQRASEQIGRLVRDELILARAELVGKARHAGLGAGLFGGGGLLALYGIGALVLAAVLGLAVVLPAWLSALIVGAALLLLAVVMALVGRAQVRRSVPPMPQETAGNVREDLAMVTTAMRNRSRP